MERVLIAVESEAQVDKKVTARLWKQGWYYSWYIVSFGHVNDERTKSNIFDFSYNSFNMWDFLNEVKKINFN